MHCTITLSENQLLQLLLEVCWCNVLCWHASVSVRGKKRNSLPGLKTQTKALRAVKTSTFTCLQAAMNQKLGSRPTEVDLWVTFGTSGDVYFMLVCLGSRI